MQTSSLSLASSSAPRRAFTLAALLLAGAALGFPSFLLTSARAAAAKSSATANADSAAFPAPAAILEQLRVANAYFMAKWPDTGKSITTNRTRPSNIWTRGVYYEGLMALHAVAPDKAYYNYAVSWGEAHKWGLRNGTTTRNADDQCCGQTYLDLYLIDRQPERLRAIKTCIDAIVASPKSDDWSWIDAAQMGMPVFAKLGALTGDPKYFARMHELYLYMKNTHGDHGLFNPAEGLWWRDKDFDPPYAEPNGKNCYWSRGNGWVVAAMVRSLDALPADHPNRAEYLAMLKTMCEALRKVQRDDGFWNVSLHDPTHFGGKETSGTALFTYGMAWGVRHGILDSATYRPIIAKAWGALSREAVQPNGFLGHVQGTGKEPKDGQPVSVSSVPDFEDYGLGCLLLAGTEVWRLVTKSAP